MKINGNTFKSPEGLSISPELEAVQSLMPMSPEDLGRLTADIKKNGVRHPVIVYRKDGALYVLAGWHRREIARALGIQVPIQEVEGTSAEFKEFCITENLNRRHLTTKQKENIVREFFRINPDDSARSIAEKVGISPTTASGIKKKAVVQIGQVKGKDGKTYTKTPKPSKPGFFPQPLLGEGTFTLTPEGYKRDKPAPPPEKKITLESRLADYAAALDDRAARLKDKANREKSKDKALMMIGEARAIAKIADEIMRIIKE